MLKSKTNQSVWTLITITIAQGGDPAPGSPSATLLRLHPSHEPQSGKRPPQVKLPASFAAHSHGVIGGLYKARERIHRNILICDY